MSDQRSFSVGRIAAVEIDRLAADDLGRLRKRNTTTRPISIGWMCRPSWAGTMPAKSASLLLARLARKAVGDVAEHGGRYAPGTDGIDIDVLGRPFAGERTGEIDDRGLGRVIGGHIGKTDLAGVGGDIDDCAALAGEGAARPAHRSSRPQR